MGTTQHGECFRRPRVPDAREGRDARLTGGGEQPARVDGSAEHVIRVRSEEALRMRRRIVHHSEGGSMKDEERRAQQRLF